MHTGQVLIVALAAGLAWSGPVSSLETNPSEGVRGGPRPQTQDSTARVHCEALSGPRRDACLRDAPAATPRPGDRAPVGATSGDVRIPQDLAGGGAPEVSTGRSEISAPPGRGAPVSPR